MFFRIKCHLTLVTCTTQLWCFVLTSRVLQEQCFFMGQHYISNIVWFLMDHNCISNAVYFLINIASQCYNLIRYNTTSCSVKSCQYCMKDTIFFLVDTTWEKYFFYGLTLHLWCSVLSYRSTMHLWCSVLSYQHCITMC